MAWSPCKPWSGAGASAARGGSRAARSIRACGLHGSSSHDARATKSRGWRRLEDRRRHDLAVRCPVARARLPHAAVRRPRRAVARDSPWEGTRSSRYVVGLHVERLVALAQAADVVLRVPFSVGDAITDRATLTFVH